MCKCSTKSFLSCLYHVCVANFHQEVILYDTLAFTAYQCCSFHALSAKNSFGGDSSGSGRDHGVLAPMEIVMVESSQSIREDATSAGTCEQ